MMMSNDRPTNPRQNKYAWLDIRTNTHRRERALRGRIHGTQALPMPPCFERRLNNNIKHCVSTTRADEQNGPTDGRMTTGTTIMATTALNRCLISRSASLILAHSARKWYGSKWRSTAVRKAKRKETKRMVTKRQMATSERRKMKKTIPTNQ